MHGVDEPVAAARAVCVFGRWSTRVRLVVALVLSDSFDFLRIRYTTIQSFPKSPAAESSHRTSCPFEPSGENRLFYPKIPAETRLLCI
jgi:hypothetical protein